MMAASEHATSACSDVVASESGTATGESEAARPGFLCTCQLGKVVYPAQYRDEVPMAVRSWLRRL